MSRARILMPVLLLMMAASPALADEAVVHIDNFTFNPAELIIKPGTTVTWKNGDDIPHSVVDTRAKFHSKALDTDETFSMTFADAGEVAYFCGLHPHMKGKIIVRP
jgi:plastocyanin